MTLNEKGIIILKGGIMKRLVTFIFTFCIILIALYSWAYAQSGIDEGIKLFEENKIPEAKKFFTSFIKSNPENAPAHYYLGRVFW